MLDIGLEIKILRERQKISSKDLARRIGLSQSQMSRLEKGQRRIDIRTLHKISEALGVAPAFFFRSLAGESGATEKRVSGGVRATLPPVKAEEAASAPIFAPPIRFDHVGKLVRSERRRRHLTVDELATRVGRTKAFMSAFEEGRHSLDPDLAEKICRALKLSPSFFVDAQRESITALETQVARLNQELAEAYRGKTDGDSGVRGKLVPLLGNLVGRQTTMVAADGRPLGEPEDFVRLPGIDGAHAFAFRVSGDAMISTSPPSFQEGDIVVFGTEQDPQSHDLALSRLTDGRLLFRQVFFEPDASMRLQPLNLQHAPETHARKDVVGIWGLAAHIRGL